MAPPFVHLSVRSVYSLREGAIRLDELAATTRSLGMQSVALTDRDSLAGAVRFTQACQRYGVRPIYGVRLTTGSIEDPSQRTIVTLLAQTQRGYENLCRLVTTSHHNGERGDPCATFEDVRTFSEGVVILLGPESDVGCALDRRAHDQARALLVRWLEVFGFARTVIEVRSWLEAGDQARVARALALSDECGVRAAATNGARAATRADAFLCDVLDAIRKLVPLAAHHRDNANHEAVLKSPQEMYQLFSARPQLLIEAFRIAEECTASLTLGKIQVPKYPLPNGLPQRSLNEMLAVRCHEGMIRRGLADNPKAKRILDEELAMCARLGFAGYFLTVGDIVARIKQTGIRSACRGSAAGSLICYLTQISEVDPVEHNLVFQRFMNPYRTTELPDIDLDVESARREDVYRDVLDRFTQNHVACVAMVDTYRARGALREVGKALALPEGEVDLVAKSFPHISASGIRAALEHLPELKRSSLRRGQMEMLFDVAERLDGFPRHLALHPSGILIAPDDLLTRTAMERSANGFRMSQFDKDDVEALGLLKLDVIGIRMLSSMTHAIAEVKRNTGEVVDLDTIPRGDPATFKLMQESRTLGCFQIESPGQRELLAKLQPDKWPDLIVEISLFRPGPVRSDMIGPYLTRRGGWARPVYAHPAMREALSDTFGVIVYHEHVMRAIAAVTGCDLSLADQVRRELEDEEVLPKIREWFFEMGRRNQWRDGEIEPVWREVSSFAAFGFCKAHAAAFAVPTYQSAWLKANYPAPFYAGILTHEPGMYPRRVLLDDAHRHGITILGLDINASAKAYTVEGDAVRIGLMHVEGINDAEVASILGARPFTGLVDFCRRTSVSRPVVENLIHAGAFDAFGGRRDQLLLVNELWDRKQPKPEPAQQSLTVQEPLVNIGLRPYSDAEKVRAELEVVGMDVSRHVVSFYGSLLQTLGVTPARALREQRNNARVMIAGVKVASQTPAVRSGQRIIFLTLDDGTGLSDATIFESVQEQCAYTAFHSWLIVVRGTLRKTGSGRGGVSINAERAWDLTELARDQRDGVLDVNALWTEGVAQIEEFERQRIAAARANRGRRPPDRTSVNPMVPIGEREPKLRPRSGEAEVMPGRGTAPAKPLPAKRPDRPPVRERPAAGAPRKLWHASGGSAG
jgi:error-prone DNA polymerase